MSMNRTCRAVLAAALATVLAGSAVAPASAADETETIARLIENVAPNQGAVLNLEESQRGFGVQTEATKIEIPDNPKDAVVLNGSAGSKSAPFEFRLPIEVDVKKGKKASDGTVIYDGIRDSASVAVQALGDGSARVQTVIPSKSAEHEFTYVIQSGYEAQKLPDGGIALAKEEADGSWSAVIIDAPWATDSAGEPVATRYEIVDDKIVQLVEASESAAYPVVADPRWAWYALAYGAKYTKAETRTLANAKGIGKICKAVIFGPFKAYCAPFALAWKQQAKNAIKQNKCVFIAAVPAPMPYVYSDKDCK